MTPQEALGFLISFANGCASTADRWAQIEEARQALGPLVYPPAAPARPEAEQICVEVPGMGTFTLPPGVRLGEPPGPRGIDLTTYLIAEAERESEPAGNTGQKP